MRTMRSGLQSPVELIEVPVVGWDLGMCVDTGGFSGLGV